MKLDLKAADGAVITGVQGSYLPTWKRRGFVGNHFIVVYGWSKKGKEPYRVYTWDPLRVSWSGAHSFRAKAVVRGMNAFGDTNMVW